MQVKTLLDVAREQARPLPIADAIGIGTGVLLELQSAAQQPIRRAGEARLRIAVDTVWIGPDGRVSLERRQGALAAAARSECGLPAVAALIATLSKDALRVPGALPSRQIRALGIILRRALSVDRVERYADAGAMQADLESFASQAGLDISRRARVRLLGERLEPPTIRSGWTPPAWPDPACLPDGAPTVVCAPALAANDERDAAPTVRSPPEGPVLGLVVQATSAEKPALTRSVMPSLATGWPRVEPQLHAHRRTCDVIRGPWAEVEAAGRAGDAASLVCSRCREPVEGGDDHPTRRLLSPTIAASPHPAAEIATRVVRWCLPLLALTITVSFVLALVVALGSTVSGRVPLREGMQRLVPGASAR